MKSYNCVYKGEDSLHTFINKHNLSIQKNMLIQIFSSIIDKDLLQKLSLKIKENLPHAHIIGATTVGEILHGEISTEEIIISFSVFEKTDINSALYSFNSPNEKSLHDTVKELIRPDTKALIVFSDGLKSNAENLLQDLSSISNKIVIVGGRAGDMLQAKESFIFDANRITDNGFVIASLSSKDLIINNDYMLGWQPIGKKMKVTKVIDNRLFELDGINITEIYKKYLGDAIVAGLPFSASEFPLIIEKNGLYIARAPIAVLPDNALLFAGNIEEGSYVQFSFGNVKTLQENVNSSFNKFNKFAAESIFVYSCSARKTLMGKDLEYELGMLESIAPSVGFFTYGEYFHSSNVNELLNITTTFISLSESPDKQAKTFNKLKEVTDNRILNALAHLTSVTTSEIEEISKTDALTELYNRRYFNEVFTAKISISKRSELFLAFAMLDIDYFKHYNDEYGHSAGDNVLKTIATTIKNTLRRPNDYAFRVGGEEFAMLFCVENRESAFNLVEKCRLDIEALAIKYTHHKTLQPITISIGLSIIDKEVNETMDQLYISTDKLLYEAKENGRNKVVCSFK